MLSPLSFSGKPFSSPRSPTFFSSPLPWNCSPDLFLVEYPQVARFQPVNGQRGRKRDGERKRVKKRANQRRNKTQGETVPFIISGSFSLFHFLPSRSLSLSLAPSSVLVIQTPSMNLLLLSFLLEEASSPPFLVSFLLHFCISLFPSRSRRLFSLPYL